MDQKHAAQLLTTNLTWVSDRTTARASLVGVGGVHVEKALEIIGIDPADVVKGVGTSSYRVELTDAQHIEKLMGCFKERLSKEEYEYAPGYIALSRALNSGPQITSAR